MDLKHNYTEALHKLLPAGVAWDFPQDSDNYKLLVGLTRIFQRVGTDADTALNNLLPAEADELITEWENLLAIPGYLTNNVLRSIKKRQLLVSLLFSDNGRQDAIYYRDLASKFGLTVDYYDMGIADVGILEAHDYLAGIEWSNVVLARFDISKAKVNLHYADAENAVAGDMLAYLVNDNNDDVNALAYLIKIRKYAHVQILIDYYDKRGF